MRGQLGPSVVPGNSQAARRLARARKPPPIILWSIGIITCLLFLGSAAMLTVGYLNPFGTVGLSILGVGAVVYFGGIIFLVLSCLWVERKYPGMQPLSFKFYSRKQQRPAPTAFANPNVSGQTSETLPSYRVHNETPSIRTSISDMEEITENVPSGPSDPTQNINDKQNGNNLLEQVSSMDHDNPFTAQQSLQDVGSEDIIKDHKPEDITITETSNQDTTAITSEKDATEYKSNAQDYNATKNIPSSSQNEGKVQQKNHQLELPVEDYSGLENSTSATSNHKESETETQGSQPKDIKQQSRKSQGISPLNAAMVPSISTSQEERTTMHQQKDTHKDDVPSLSTKEHQSTEKQSLPVQQTQQNTSQTVTTETHRLFKKNKNARDISQRDKLQRRRAVHVRKLIKERQSQDLWDTSQEKKMGITPTDTALLAEGRKPILLKKQDTVLQSANPEQNSAVLTKTSGNERKRVQFQEYHVQSVQNLAKDNPKVSSVADAKDALQFKNDRRYGHQHKSLTNDDSESTQHFSQNLDFQSALPGFVKKKEIPQKQKKVESPERMKNDLPDRARKPESPGLARKKESPERARNPESPGRAREQESPKRTRNPESPERGKRLRIEHKLSHSPPNARKIVTSSSPTRHHQSLSPKAQRNKDNSIAMTNLSSSKEELYRRRNRHSSQSSQSSDLPSSTSSSPPRHPNRSPEFSPKLPKHQFHASGNTEFYSSARKEVRHDRHSQQSSPSSYSSDSPSSTSSSPQRHRRKNADFPNIAQRQEDKLTVNSGFPSNTKKDDLNKKLSQQSSQSNEVTLSPAMPATKLLQHKLDRADLKHSFKSPHTTDPSIQTSGAKSEYKQQTKHQHQDKPRLSSHSREFSPTAVRTSSLSNKRFPANPREDQT